MTKLKLLELFERYKGDYLSGEVIAKDLGLSRTAIWKNINSLREEGYDIESTKRLGYRLNANSDILSHTKIKQFLIPELSLDRIYLYKDIDSTNKEALLESIKCDESWIVVASERQERGEAKNQMPFYSPEGKGVYMSVIIHMNEKFTQLDSLLKLNSEAVSKAILNVSGIKGDINEENNILYDDRKLCGIMTNVLLEAESKCIKKMVIGIGIYVHEAKEENIALTEITGKYCNRSQLIAEVLNELYKHYNKVQ